MGRIDFAIESSLVADVFHVLSIDAVRELAGVDPCVSKPPPNPASPKPPLAAGKTAGAGAAVVVDVNMCEIPVLDEPSVRRSVANLLSAASAMRKWSVRSLSYIYTYMNT
jgi:hypothetical protein